MKTSLPICSLLLVSLTACTPDQPPAASDAATPADAPTATTATAVVPPADTTMAVAGVQPEPAFDAKALAGRFAGVLSCSGCPGRETALQLNPDGSYQMDETIPDQHTELVFTTGTWSTERTDAGQLLRLDPDSKDAADRVFAIEASNLLRVRNADGTTLAGDDAVLTRR